MHRQRAQRRGAARLGVHAVNVDPGAQQKPVALDVPRAELGEGPVWDGPSQSLVWVDFTGRYVHRYWPIDERASSHRTRKPADPFAPASRKVHARSRKRLLDGDRGVRRRQAAGHRPRVGQWSPLQRREVRPGRAVLGGIDGLRDHARGGGPVPPRSRSGRHPGPRRRRISNGIDWSLDGRTCYYIDTLTQAVFVPFRLRPGERRALVQARADPRRPR